MRIEAIELSHREIFERAAAAFPPVISEHTFANLFIWRTSRPVRIAQVSDALVVVAGEGERAALLGEPIGALSVAEALRRIHEAGVRVAEAERIPERALSSIPEGWRAEEDRGNFDYVYRRADLAELAGRRYHAKRNLIAQCLSEHDCTYEEISPANRDDVARMMEGWCARHDCGTNRSLCEEYRAIGELFEHYDALGVMGAAIRIRGEIAAFTTGGALTPTTAVVHAEKAMPEFKGLYQVMNQWFCQNHLAGFEFVNREQDLGLEGLRQAKESYFPDHLVKKYRLRPKPKTGVNA